MTRTKPVIVDLHYRAEHSLPASDETFYQCVCCWDIVSSIPNDNVSCACGNVKVDVDAGRAGAKQEASMRVLKLVRRPC